jgi:hypothetical protein
VKSEEVLVELMLKTDFRDNLRKKMAEEERKGHLMTEAVMNNQRNVKPEMFVNYMKKHNLWIKKENFYGYFEMMSRLKSFTEYVRRNQKSLNVIYYLPEDDKKVVEQVKKEIEITMQPAIVRTLNIERKSVVISKPKINDIKIKYQNKICYSEPRECKSKIKDSECEKQTIYHQLDLDEPCAAADINVKSNQLNVRQIQVVESNNISFDGKICLISETNPSSSIEEGNHCYVFREVYSFSSTKNV